MRRFAARLLEFLRLTRRDADVRREIDAHLALMQDDFESRGLSPEAARRAARVAFGGIEQTREAHRDARSFPALETAWQDVTLGVRLLRRSPLFTLTAAASLAIGLGVNTAIFAVADSLLFRPPDGIQQPERLVDIGAARDDGGLNPIPFSLYRNMSHGLTALSGVFAEEMFPHAMSMRASDASEAERISGQAVTATFFDVLGARPHVGRLFSETDEVAATVGVLDYDFWGRRFGGDPRLVGRVLHINDRAITIVGVTAQRFEGTHIQKRDVWLILPPSRRASVMVGGRLRDDASVAEAAAQVAAATAAAGLPAPASDRIRTTALPFSRAGGNRVVVAALSLALMTLVSLVLAIAGANVAGIMIARSSSRQSELALRTALGATRGRLLRQLLTEIAVLFALGGAAGILLAWMVVGIVRATSMVPGVSIPVDWRVVSFGLALSLAAAVLSGLVPAMRGSKVQPGTVFKDGSHASHGGSRSRAMFVCGQVTISVVLVALCALFVRAVRLAGLSEPGFEPQGVALTTIDLSMAGHIPVSAGEFWRDALDRVGRLPGVEAAALARVPPGGWEGIGLGGVDVADHPGRLAGFSPSWNIVGPGYFAALRIPIHRGRDFSRADTAQSPLVVIIAAALAKRSWPGEDATGRYLTLSTFNLQTSQWEKKDALVVGVVGDIKSSSLIDGFAEPYVYLPLAQANTDFTKTMTIVTRSRSPGITLQAQIERAIRDIDPDLVAAQAVSLADAIRLGLAPQRALATAAGSLGLVGLLLASIGIYGVIAYNIARRRREIGIRMALGASRAAIVWIVVRQAAWVVAVGIILGLSLATGLGRGLSVFFYGLQATHAATFLVTASIVATVSSLACYVPTRHAIGVEPSQALRTD